MTPSTDPSLKTKHLNGHEKRPRGRVSAKDDAFLCRSRQEEYHKLKISQMKEIHELEAQEHRLNIKKLNLQIQELEKRNMLMENIQTRIVDVHNNLNKVLESAKRAYDAMGPVDD